MLGQAGLNSITQVMIYILGYDLYITKGRKQTSIRRSMSAMKSEAGWTHPLLQEAKHLLVQRSITASFYRHAAANSYKELKTNIQQLKASYC